MRSEASEPTSWVEQNGNLILGGRRHQASAPELDEAGPVPGGSGEAKSTLSSEAGAAVGSDETELASLGFGETGPESSRSDEARVVTLETGEAGLVPLGVG